jgi:hypothetical protein
MNVLQYVYVLKTKNGCPLISNTLPVCIESNNLRVSSTFTVTLFAGNTSSVLGLNSSLLSLAHVINSMYK